MRPSPSQHSSPSLTKRWCSQATRHAVALLRACVEKMAGPQGSWTKEQVDGETSMSKEEEISTIEKEEGENMYKAYVY